MPEPRSTLSQPASTPTLKSWNKHERYSGSDDHPLEGYRRLNYMMMDDDVVAICPGSVYRVLTDASLLNPWNRDPSRQMTARVWRQMLSFRSKLQKLMEVCSSALGERRTLSCAQRAICRSISASSSIVLPFIRPQMNSSFAAMTISDRPYNHRAPFFLAIRAHAQD